MTPAEALELLRCPVHACPEGLRNKSGDWRGPYRCPSHNFAWAPTDYGELRAALEKRVNPEVAQPEPVHNDRYYLPGQVT